MGALHQIVAELSSNAKLVLVFTFACYGYFTTIYYNQR